MLHYNHNYDINVITVYATGYPNDNGYFTTIQGKKYHEEQKLWLVSGSMFCDCSLSENICDSNDKICF